MSNDRPNSVLSIELQPGIEHMCQTWGGDSRTKCGETSASPGSGVGLREAGVQGALQVRLWVQNFPATPNFLLPRQPPLPLLLALLSISSSLEAPQRHQDQRCQKHRAPFLGGLPGASSYLKLMHMDYFNSTRSRRHFQWN